MFGWAKDVWMFYGRKNQILHILWWSHPELDMGSRLGSPFRKAALGIQCDGNPPLSWMLDLFLFPVSNKAHPSAINPLGSKSNTQYSLTASRLPLIPISVWLLFLSETQPGPSTSSWVSRPQSTRVSSTWKTMFPSSSVKLNCEWHGGHHSWGAFRQSCFVAICVSWSVATHTNSYFQFPSPSLAWAPIACLCVCFQFPLLNQNWPGTGMTLPAHYERWIARWSWLSGPEPNKTSWSETRLWWCLAWELWWVVCYQVQREDSSLGPGSLSGPLRP